MNVKMFPGNNQKRQVISKILNCTREGVGCFKGF